MLLIFTSVYIGFFLSSSYHLYEKVNFVNNPKHEALITLKGDEFILIPHESKFR